MLIGDAARSCGVSARMLRHYEALGLVRPTGRTSAGYRDYSDEDIRRIFQVESLRSMGLSLKQVGRALEDPDLTPAALVVDLIRCTEERLAQERELLDRLRAIDASAPADWRDVLRVIDLMRDLDSESAARRQQAVLIRSAGAPVPVELLAEALLSESEPDVAGALRWALARAGGAAVVALRAGACAEDAGIRRRAVRAISEMPEAPGATAVLAQALDDPDAAVRDCAALALGRCGMTEAVPVLVSMVAEGTHDVEAAEVLGLLCHDDERASWIVNALTDELAAPTAGTSARLRLTQALVELPVAAAEERLRRLTRDSDPDVARLASAFV